MTTMTKPALQWSKSCKAGEWIIFTASPAVPSIPQWMPCTVKEMQYDTFRSAMKKQALSQQQWMRN